MLTIRQGTNGTHSRIHHKPKQLAWRGYAGIVQCFAWPSLTRANCPAVSFYWHDTWYKPRVTTCLFLIIARSELRSQWQTTTWPQPLTRRRNKPVSFSWSVPVVSSKPNDRQRLNLGLALKAKREKSEFQSKWDAFYTHKSSCDLEIPIFFRCSNWLFLA